ncbi:MAG: beta-galactosidase [Syntrophobacteraceae bacterium]
MVRFIAAVLLFAATVCTNPAAASEGRPAPGWSTVEKDGVWWLVTPEGNPFYSKGVNIVEPFAETPLTRKMQEYCWNNFYSSIPEWGRCVGRQLHSWGFNTLGGWSASHPEIGLPLTVDLELGRNSKFHWFDPFHPSMEEMVVKIAGELTADLQDHPRLIGYYSDNEVGWWNSPIFMHFLKADWQNYTKRALWQMIYDRYGGDWNRLLQDWVPTGSLGSFEELKRAGAELKLRPGGMGIRTVNAFMHIYTKRYYQLMHDAIRKVHPGALVLGDRMPLYYHQDAVMAMGDNVDIISTNYNVDVPDGWVAPYYFDGLRRLTNKPVLVTEFFFAAEENRSGNRNETARNPHPNPGHLMTVDTQAERAWGASRAIVNFAGFPNVVGAHWFQYADEPLGGRNDGEDYNMGLVDTANRPYEEVTEIFRSLNPVLDLYHRKSVERAGSTPGGSGADPGRTASIPRAAGPMDVSEQSLLDWDKAATRIPDIQTPAPYVPFGDIHLTWTPEGLYLASLSNTYVDPIFMGGDGEFPLQETFQLHVTVEAQGQRNSYGIYLVPRANSKFPDGFEITPQLYREPEGKPLEPLPLKGRVQRIEKALPHMVLEAFFPAEWMGMERLSAGTRFRVGISITNYYKELTMSWPGATGTFAPGDSGGMKTVVLEGTAG